MGYKDIIIIAVIILVIGAAVFHIYKGKKSGNSCMGCPYSGTCSSGCSGCNCGCADKEQSEPK